jgi:hypothetical protein
MNATSEAKAEQKDYKTTSQWVENIRHNACQLELAPAHAVSVPGPDHDTRGKSGPT